MVSKEYMKREVFTVPNMLSFLRLVLIPVFAVLYLTGKWLASIIVLAVSTLSDLFDGKLARKLGQVSELGELLDPLADKLTQGTIVICMGIKYPIMWIMFGFEVLKEGFMIGAGAYTLKHYGSKLKGAEWFGKVGTTLIDAALLAFLIFPGMSDQTRKIMVTAVCVVMLLTMLLYLNHYIMFWRELKKSGVRGNATLLPKMDRSKEETAETCKAAKVKKQCPAKDAV